MMTIGELYGNGERRKCYDAREYESAAVAADAGRMIRAPTNAIPFCTLQLNTAANGEST